MNSVRSNSLSLKYLRLYTIRLQRKKGLENLSLWLELSSFVSLIDNRFGWFTKTFNIKHFKTVFDVHHVKLAFIKLKEIRENKLKRSIWIRFSANYFSQGLNFA